MAKRRSTTPETRVIRAKGLRTGDVIITETQTGLVHRLAVESIQRRTKGWPSGRAALFVKVDRRGDERLFYTETSPVKIER